ncbi:MAG: Protein of unknown function precursor [Ferruginibacter sp.]|nr:Protein of unknown function precursor [Ferruginibacter sp.]
MKTFLFISLFILSCQVSAQVRIGAGTQTVNPAAVLELSNNLAAAPSSWKSLIPPYVDFSNPAFTSNSSWGIAGTPVPGALVYNIAEKYTNGFAGPGLYCWQRNGWSPVVINVTDKIRAALITSVQAYDAAPVNSWVTVTGAEYVNLLTVVSGTARYATPEIYMNTTASGGWTNNYTVGGSLNSLKIPASSYIIAWSVRVGAGASNALGSKLKLSLLQNSGYTDFGSSLPNTGTINANTRVYFVMKSPNLLSPDGNSFTAVYNAQTYFLGNNVAGGAGPEYFQPGDGGSPGTSYSSDSYSQVIATSTRQW